MVYRWFFVVAFLITFQSVAQQQDETLKEYEVKILLRQRIDIHKKSVGMAVGIITPKEQKIICYGSTNLDDDVPVTARTVFEIGGITRLFTNLVFADMVERGEVSPQDPLNRFLPPRARIPSFHGRQIKLIDLATQTSGLPFLPDKSRPGDSTFNGGFTKGQLADWLSSFRIPATVGQKWLYSDLGTGLLAEALCNRLDLSYDSLVMERILIPLKMTSTAVHLSAIDRLRLAKGYTDQLQPAPVWWMPALEGAESLRSTPADMMKLLSAFVSGNSPLAVPMKRMIEVTRDGPGLLQGLGWLVSRNSKGEVVATAGGETLGFSSFISFNQTTGTGVIVLSNSSDDQGGIGPMIVH